jgi:hypothetical protein
MDLDKQQRELREEGIRIVKEQGPISYPEALAQVQRSLGVDKIKKEEIIPDCQSKIGSTRSADAGDAKASRNHLSRED